MIQFEYSTFVLILFEFTIFNFFIPKFVSSF